MTDEIKHVSSPAATAVCATSGLPIRKDPEWTDVYLGGNHRVSVSVIGKQIVVSHPTGYNRRDDLKPALDLIHHVTEVAIPADRRFVWIADYSELEGSSLRGRRYFAESCRERDGGDW